MRIDLFLHRVRLARSRSLAQALVAEGRTRIDGRRVDKPSEPVRAGSIVAVPIRGRVRILRVRLLPDRRGPPAEARAAYEEIDEVGAAT